MATSPGTAGIPRLGLRNTCSSPVNAAKASEGLRARSPQRDKDKENDDDDDRFDTSDTSQKHSGTECCSTSTSEAIAAPRTAGGPPPLKRQASAHALQSNALDRLLRMTASDPDVMRALAERVGFDGLEVRACARNTTTDALVHPPNSQASSKQRMAILVGRSLVNIWPSLATPPGHP
jgi:hypothetical protein